MICGLTNLVNTVLDKTLLDDSQWRTIWLSDQKTIGVTCRWWLRYVAILLLTTAAMSSSCGNVNPFSGATRDLAITIAICEPEVV